MVKSRPSGPDVVLVNEDGRSVGASLSRLLDDLARRKQGPVTLFTGYLSIRGLLELLPSLHKLDQARVPVRLLCGVSPPEDAAVLVGLPGIETGDQDVSTLLAQAHAVLDAEINHIPVSRTRGLALLELAGLLDSDNVECRREEHRMLHAKGVVAHDVQVIGSANLTLPGTRWNRELSATIQPTSVPLARHYVDQWWDEAQPYDLAASIRHRFAAHRPELVYLTMLKCAFGDQVDHASELDLRAWQRDGVAKALTVLDSLGGVLLCDDVGLGKTEEAIAIALDTMHRHGGRVLVVCPASLKPMWAGTLQHWPIPCDVISYDKLVRETNQDRNDHGAEATWLGYSLIICDEAHHLRNPERQRAAAIRHVLDHQAQRPRIVLITATPVNNSGLDLYELLCLADPTLEPHWAPVNAATPPRRRGRSGVGWRLFQVCQNPSKHTPEGAVLRSFYGALDDRMVRRGRSLIRTTYPDSATHFPRRRHRALHYRLTGEHRQLVGDVLDSLGAGSLPDTERQLRELRGPRPRMPRLTLAAYRTDEYRWDTSAKRVPVAPFIKCMLLKRLESSPAAFASTANRVLGRIRIMLRDLDNGWVNVPGRSFRRRLTQAFATGILDDEDIDTHESPTDLLDNLVTDLTTSGATDRHPTGDFDLRRLRADLEHDHQALARMARSARHAVTDDAKCDTLRDLLVDVVRQQPGAKILLLTSSRQTAVDLNTKLTKSIKDDPNLAVLKGRMTTAALRKPLTKDGLLKTIAHFVPRTAARPSPGVRQQRPNDLYDLLIGTDQLSEGHNLQQASVLINYDLPWNPQALGQRIGRLDRFDAEHDLVHCYTVLPDTALDLVLNLLTILHRKIDAAASTVGVPAALLPHTTETPRDFATTLNQLDREPHPPPISPYERARTVLGNALRTPGVPEALHRLPPGAGAVHPRQPAIPEAVFCFTVTTNTRTETALCHLVEGHPHAVSTETLDCLHTADVDTGTWLANRQRPLLDDAADPHALHTLLWSMVDRARDTIAAQYGIHAAEAIDRIQLRAWMSFPTSGAR